MHFYMVVKVWLGLGEFKAWLQVGVEILGEGKGTFPSTLTPPAQSALGLMALSFIEI